MPVCSLKTTKVTKVTKVVVDSTLYQSGSGQAKINRMTSAVTPRRDDEYVRMAMSSTEPEDTDQLPLPLDTNEAGRSTVVSIGSAPRGGRAATAPRTLEPARTALTDAEIAHRRVMLEHLAKVGQSA
jgi:hypothetical protein